MHEGPLKVHGAEADALLVLMNGQPSRETWLPVFACRKACKIQSKGTRALRSNQRFHNIAAATENPIIGSLDARCRSSRAFP